MKIKGFEDVSPGDVQVNIRMNEHSVCTFTAYVDKDDVSKYTDMAKRNATTYVATQLKDGIQLMSGFVQSVRVKSTQLSTVIFVSIISSSYMADCEVHNRIFQNTDKTAETIVDAVHKNCENGYKLSFCQNEGMKDTVEKIVLQRNTSDFCFIRQLAAEFGCGLWVDGDELVVGSINSNFTVDTASDDPFKEVISCEVEYTKDNEILTFITEQYIKNGSKISYDGKEYVICETNVTEKGIFPYYRYTAYMKPELELERYKSTESYCVAERAKVISNNDSDGLGRIQVEYIDIDDMTEDKDKAYFTDYASPYVGKCNGGLTMLPDEDDVVSVIICDGVPLAIGSVRANPIKDGCNDPEHKLISVGEDMVLRFAEDKITLSNTDETTLTIAKDSIELKQGNSIIGIDEKHISVSCEDTSLVTESDKVSLKSGNTDIRVTSDNITIKNSSTDIKVTGSDIDVKSNSASIKSGSASAKLTGSDIKLKTSGAGVEIASDVKLSGGQIKLQSPAVGI